ncbi:MAG TPA: hypothetical protein VGG05_14975 [Pseudonocardiaceae bacterium]
MGEVRNQVTGDVSGTVIQVGTVRLPDVPVPVALAGLPADEGFTGRDADLAALAAVLAPGAGVTTCAIAGLPGVGKTALAVTAARTAVEAGWFAGGGTPPTSTSRRWSSATRWVTATARA